jgi:hypothetical protein
VIETDEKLVKISLGSERYRAVMLDMTCPIGVHRRSAKQGNKFIESETHELSRGVEP